MDFDIKEFERIVRQGSNVKTIVDADRVFAVLADDGGGERLEEIKEPHGLQREKPLYIDVLVLLQTAVSLADYVNRYKNAETTLFADINSSVIIAEIDYHAKDQAEHCSHIARLALQFSEEWLAWTKIDGTLMGQLEFARFLEEHTEDIQAPAAGDLLDACRDLQAHRKVTVHKAVRTNTDHENFEYTEETNATTKRDGFELPTTFLLAIPVYFNTVAVPVKAFLRWRLNDGALQLGIKIHQVALVRQRVFTDIVDSVGLSTSVHSVYGTPG